METAKHLVKLIDFTHLDVTGVREVLAFDERRIELSLGDTVLLIGGTNLKIESFSRESGAIVITGAIDSLFSEADAAKPAKNGLISRIFS